VAAFTRQPAWTLDPLTGQLYLHLFLPEQPDLNWDNPEVVAAMHDVLRFWLDRGVDGFRIDVVHALGKDIDQDDPEDWVAQKLPHASLNDQPGTHEHLRALRRLLDSYPGDRAMVGEVYLLDTTKVSAYYGHGDELHLSFNFPFLFAPWDGEALRERIEQSYALFDPVHAWPTWVLSNHDAVRHRTRYGGPEPRARAAAVLLVTLRGTPFLYQGEELGLENAHIPPERVVDPGGRDGCRAPIPWTPAPDHGWPADPWLPFAPEPDHRNMASFAADDRSILALYRRLLALRRSTAALRTGAFAWLAAPDGVLAYERAEGGEVIWVVVNPTGAEQAVELPGPATVVIASDGTGEGAPFGGRVRSDTAVVLSPASGA
jgi:alpha-glucosidase